MGLPTYHTLGVCGTSLAQVLACGCSSSSPASPAGRMPLTRSESRLEERRCFADVRRRERDCDKRDNIARRQERIGHINGEAVQLARFSADAAAQAAVLSKRQVDNAFTKPQAQAKMIESASARPCSRARCLS